MSGARRLAHGASARDAPPHTKESDPWDSSRLRSVPSGIVTDNVLTLHLTPRAEAQDYYAIEQRVAALSGVRAAGLTQLVPLQNWGWEADFRVRGLAMPGRPIAGLRYVTPGYFRAMGIRMVRGREFTSHDDQGAPRVIVVNEALRTSVARCCNPWRLVP